MIQLLANCTATQQFCFTKINSKYRHVFETENIGKLQKTFFWLAFFVLTS